VRHSYIKRDSDLI